MLIDEEVDKIRSECSHTNGHINYRKFARSIERAVLAKAEKKEGAAIMVFCGNFVGSLDAGFIDSNHMSIAQLYQCARNHVKDNYDMDTKTLEEEVGKEFYDKCAHPQPAQSAAIPTQQQILSVAKMVMPAAYLAEENYKICSFAYALLSASPKPE